MHGHSVERIQEIWLVASLYPTDGHEGLASAARARARSRLACRLYEAANDWRAYSGNSELAGGRRDGSSAVGERIVRRRREM